MNDHFIKTSELPALLAIFVVPFLLSGAIVQFIVLHRAEIRKTLAFTLVGIALPVSILLCWGVIYVLYGIVELPMLLMLEPGGILVLPALVATSLTTSVIGWYAYSRAEKRGFPNWLLALDLSLAFSILIWITGFVFNAPMLAGTLIFPAMWLLLTLQPGLSIHNLDHGTLLQQTLLSIS